jgi:hypothetical protein
LLLTSLLLRAVVAAVVQKAVAAVALAVTKSLLVNH